MAPKQEIAMYGCLAKDIETGFKDAQKLGYSRDLYIMAILSDVQEAMTVGELEMARQFVNKAKYLLSQKN